jgi:DNA-binding NarL/FixJ family response regulator
MNASPPVVFCVMPARSMKEISPFLQNVARLRWVPDDAALLRMFMVHPKVDACLVEMSHNAAVTLEQVRQRSPATRRVVLTDACDLRTVRTLLDTHAAQEMVYRPLDAPSLLSAIGLGRSNKPRVASPDAMPNASGQ